VSDADGTTEDMSNAVFQVAAAAAVTPDTPSITVVAPNGGESYTAGDAVAISWSSNLVNNVKISVSSNAGTYIDIVTVSGADGSYTWSPAAAIANAKIKVSDADGTTEDVSNAVFQVAAIPVVTPDPASITVVSPNGGESYASAEGLSLSIQWEAENLDAAAVVSISYQLNGGTWVVLPTGDPVLVAAVNAASDDLDAAEADLTAKEAVLADAQAADVLADAAVVDAQAAYDAAVAAANAAPADAALAAAKVAAYVALQDAITAAAATQADVDAAQADVAAAQTAVDDAQAAYDAALAAAAASGQLASEESYDWAVGTSVVSNNIRIKIVSGANSDMSDAVFSITAEAEEPVDPVVASIELLTPNGGESFDAGDEVMIAWSAVDVESVAITLTTDGVTFTDIATVEEGSSYTWTPAVGYSNAKIKVSDASDASVCDKSDMVFTVNAAAPAIGAPAALVITDVPNDNGGFAYFNFTVSDRHPGVVADDEYLVSSYEIYRDISAVDVTAAQWVAWAQVPAYYAVDADNKLTVIVPTINNTVSNWKMLASTAKASSGETTGQGGSAKAADGAPVATLLDGAAKAADGVYASDFSSVASGYSVDNIAPGSFTAFNAVDNPDPGLNKGVLLTWDAPENHGIVGSWTMSGVTYYIYGAEKYDVYRKFGAGDYVKVGSALRGAESFIDNIVDSTKKYTYMVQAVDGNVLHEVYTSANSAIACANLRVGDFTSDNYVNISDFAIFGDNYLKTSDNPEWDQLYDLDSDGTIVNISDFAVFGDNYLKGTPPAGKAADGLNAGVNVDASMVLNVVRADAETNADYVAEVSIQNVTELKSFDFKLAFNPEKVEFLSVDGLGEELTLIRTEKPGELLVAKAFREEDVFDGIIRVNFASTGKAGDSMMSLVAGNLADESYMANMIDEANLGTFRLEALPTVFALDQNFPNPFNPITTIRYSIPTDAHVELVIINLNGQVVRTLVNNDQRADFYNVVWNGRNQNGNEVATGMYFYRIQAGKLSDIKKLMLIK